MDTQFDILAYHINRQTILTFISTNETMWSKEIPSKTQRKQHGYFWTHTVCSHIYNPIKELEDMLRFGQTSGP